MIKNRVKKTEVNMNKLDFNGQLQIIPKPITDQNLFCRFQS